TGRIENHTGYVNLSVMTTRFFFDIIGPIIIPLPALASLIVNIIQHITILGGNRYQLVNIAALISQYFLNLFAWRSAVDIVFIFDHSLFLIPIVRWIQWMPVPAGSAHVKMIL